MISISFAGKSIPFLVLASALGLLPSAPVHARQVVPVSDMAALYAAVNNSANAGALVTLAPGVYMLDQNNVHGGRLELQADMALQGSAGNPEDAVIDASALPASSYSVPGFTTGAVRTGRGSNSIEWLTVRGAVRGASGIATDLVSGLTAQVRVAHVIARGNARGLDARNISGASAGRVLELDVADNLFVDNVVGAGQGLRMVNSDASGATIRATLVGNRSIGNIAGCIAANINTLGASVTIRSQADRFEGNGNGCVFLAGLSQAAATTHADDNVLIFEAYASTFEHNLGALPPAFPIAAGILAIGGQSLGGANRASGNTLHVGLWGAKLGDNGGADIKAYGAFTAASLPAGSDNEVTIELHGVSKQAIVPEPANVPAEVGGTNTVTLIR